MDAKLLATLTETEALGDRFLDARQKVGGWGACACAAAPRAAEAACRQWGTALHACMPLQAVGLDRRRQELREALTALRKQQQDGSSKGWVQLRGGPMVKMAVPQALEALQTGAGLLLPPVAAPVHAAFAAPACHVRLPVISPVLPRAAEQASVEQELALVRAEEKRLMGMLAERGAGPQSCGPGVLHAMLSLGGSG